MATTEITALLAEQVEKSRRCSGITIVQLAESTGIPFTTLYRKLKGQTDFNVPDLIKISGRLGVQFSDWLRVVPEEAA